jgi:hypothetical protein
LGPNCCWNLSSPSFCSCYHRFSRTSCNAFPNHESSGRYQTTSRAKVYHHEIFGKKMCTH